MTIDAHCHAWRTWPYPDRPAGPNTDGTVESLLRAMDASDVEQALIVCAGPDGSDNNTYAATAVRQHPERLAMAADVDSRWSSDHHTPGGAARLARVADSTGAVGISHYCDTGDDGWFDSTDGLAFLAEIQDRGLLLSLHAGPGWFDAVARLAQRFPHLVILLHHVGHATNEASTAALCQLANEPGVHIKASGLHYLGDAGEDRGYAQGLSRLRQAAEAFGPERMVWGSDFPVAPRYGLSYPETLDLVRNGIFFGDANALHSVLHGTMSRILEEAGRS